jgi:hypothetical protein
VVQPCTMGIWKGTISRHLSSSMTGTASVSIDSPAPTAIVRYRRSSTMRLHLRETRERRQVAQFGDLVDASIVGG